MSDLPHPPGDYAVIVIGSGPGGLQTSRSLSQLGIRHAVLSADARPGGTFLRWPHFQRLITWTKPHTGLSHDSRSYERYDWNSLLGEAEGERGLTAAFMDGSSYFPRRAEMEASLAAFAARAGIAVRYGCRLESTEREGDVFRITTSHGIYTTRNLVIATGMTRPYRPAIPGLEAVPHYAEVKPLESYRDRRVLIIGKRNSGFELADGLLPHARQIVLASPSPASFALETHTIAGVRARYVQPFEDHLLRGGVFVLDASIEALERRAGAIRARLRLSQSGEELGFDFDEVIAATGFQSHIGDLSALGARTHGHLEVPAQTPHFESATVPGLFFAGSLTQGARGLRKNGIPSASASVHGFRYNARILARHIAEERLGMTVPRRALAPDAVVPYLLSELTKAPELWLQRSYLARVIALRGERIVDDGIVPLHHFVDSEGEDAVGVAIELNAAGENYPAIYVRRSGELTERALDGNTLADFETPRYAAELGSLIEPIFGATVSARL